MQCFKTSSIIPALGDLKQIHTRSAVAEGVLAQHPAPRGPRFTPEHERSCVGPALWPLNSIKF